MTGISQRDVNIALRDVARCVRAEVPMIPVRRRKVSSDDVRVEGEICAMMGKYSYPKMRKVRSTYLE